MTEFGGLCLILGFLGAYPPQTNTHAHRLAQAREDIILTRITYLPKSKSLFISTLLLFVAASAMGCATERVTYREAARHTVVVEEQPGPDKVVIVTRRPPSPRREVQPRRPSSRHVWVGGHWTWQREEYVWASGQWVVAPRHGARWIAGHWKKQRGGWVWAAGHWRY